MISVLLSITNTCLIFVYFVYHDKLALNIEFFPSTHIILKKYLLIC